MHNIYSIRSGDYLIIPTSYNAFSCIIRSTKNTPLFAKQNTLSNDFVRDLMSFIDLAGSRKIIVIDCEYVVAYENKSFSLMQEVKNKNKVVFINVDTTLRKMLVEDLYLDEENIIRDNVIIYSLKLKPKIIPNFVEEISHEVKKHIYSLTKKYSRKTSKGKGKKYHYLDSSGVYSNTYVNIKQIFNNVLDYTYIVYRLAETAQKRIAFYDALISTSKNGAILANLLGQILDKKVVHCISVGPKFALSLDQLDSEIREKKNYLYVFDFICLGTEVKILNAIIASKKANLIGGVGVASLIDNSNPDVEGSIISKMDYLVNIVDFGADYKIDISEERLETQIKSQKVVEQ